MHLRPVFRRAPSAPMVISIVALFMSLGGVGWAATQIPAGSVGSDQLQNGSVTNPKVALNAIGFRKIIDGSVGIHKINPSTVQARVGSTCSSTEQAITAISGTGKVTCDSAPPQEFGALTTSPVTVTGPTTATSILTKSLPGASSYLAFATPYVQVSNGQAGQQVTVSCTLAVGPATTATQTRTVTIQFTGPTARDQAVSIPLAATAPSSTNSITANVSCTRAIQGGTTSPTVSVSGSFNAIQTQSNN
jgi:hypothetical protein